MASRNTIVSVAALLLMLVALAACSSNNGGSATPTATPPSGDTPTATAPPGATPEPTFQGSREPVEGSLGVRGTPPPIGTLVDVRAAEHEGFDRIVFEFEGPPTDYRVEYVTNPTQCGSGEAVDIEGNAVLAVSLNPVNAHTDDGAPTLDFQSIAPALPSIIEAVQSCDFEAHVNWLIGLTEEADFHVDALQDPLRLSIDIAHPQ